MRALSNAMFFRKPLALFLFPAAFLLAAPVSSATLEELLTKSDAHPSVERAKTDRDVAAFDVDAAEWRRYPSLSISAATKNNNPNAATMTLEQPVWSGGSITSGIEAAQSGLGAAKENVDVSRDTALRDIGRNYIELNRFAEKLDAAYESIKVLDQLRETIKLRVDQKISPRSEYVTVDSRLHQAKSTAFQIEGGKQRAIEALLEATDVMVENTQALNCKVSDAYTAKSLTQRGMDRSPLLKRLRLEKSRYESEVSQTQAEWLPKLVIGVENMREDGFSGNDDTTAYLALRYQLTDGLSSLSKTSAARSRVASATYQLKISERELRQEIRTLIENYASASNQIKPLEDLVEANAQLIDSYLLQYKVGKKSWLDVVNAEREYVQARMSLIDARNDQCASAFDLQVLASETFVVTK